MIDRLDRVDLQPQRWIGLRHGNISLFEQREVMSTGVGNRARVLTPAEARLQHAVRGRTLDKHHPGAGVIRQLKELATMIRVAESGIQDDRIFLLQGLSRPPHDCTVGTPMGDRAVDVVPEAIGGLVSAGSPEQLLTDDIRAQNRQAQRFR